MAYCENCKQECDLTTLDNSFTHEFGIERVITVISSCCEATVYTNQCKACNGKDSSCPECHGIGLVDEIYEIE